VSGQSPPRVDRARWREVQELFYQEHRQGEHVAVVGVNGSGKSVLLFELAKLRARRRATDGEPSRVTVLATKPRDKTIDALGWPHVKSWPPPANEHHVIVWPPYGDPETAVARHRRVFQPLLRRIFVEGGQTVVFDEIAYFTDGPPEGLALRHIVGQYYRLGRSNDLSAMGGTQRPANVPRSFWSESDWLAIFPLYDHDDLKRVTEIGGRSDELLAAIAELDEHECLFIRRRGSKLEMVRTQVELTHG
jgi:energy-coupling factor transporter ATP-binding protein EcfA2